MWINPTYPIYNWGYNPLTKWDEPTSMEIHGFVIPKWCTACFFLNIYVGLLEDPS